MFRTRVDGLLSLKTAGNTDPKSDPEETSNDKNAPTNPGVVSFCFQFSNFFFPFKELFPAHIEFFSKCCELLENRTEKDPLGQTLIRPLPP